MFDTAYTLMFFFSGFLTCRYIRYWI